MKNLIILRGLPSSGKSTFADLLKYLSMASSQNSLYCVTLSVHTTDDYPGLYDRQGDTVQFNGHIKDEDGVPMIAKAHEWNQRNAEQSMMNGCENVVIANTNTQRWEMQAYLDLAKSYDYRVTVLEVQSDATCEELAERNANGTPLEVIQRMKAGFEHDWGKGNPIAPWLRTR